LTYVKIKVDVLYSTYANTLKPIVYGNFRNIGARTVTDLVDITFLDNVITTVATNAIICTYAVCFNKAARIDSNAVTLFGNFNPVDVNRFPSLTTLLISAMGPLEASHLPYKCTFIPYLVETEVTALTNQAGYTTHYYESFLQAMKRGRTISMADVDVHTRESSPWWTLYMDNVRPTRTGTVSTPGHITAYNPNSFDDRSTAIILGSIVLEDTLFDLPGPLIVATVGPFAAIRIPRNIDDIPDPFNTSVSINPHYPAIHISFAEDRSLTHSDALTFGIIQNDENIINLSGLHHELSDEDSNTTTAVAASRQPTKKSKTSRGNAKATEASGPANSLEPVGPQHASLYLATVIYFDHKLANRVPHLRRSNVVTDSNKLE